MQLSTSTNTLSGAPAAATSKFSDQPRTNYYAFTVTPSDRNNLTSSHVRGYVATGSGTGSVEATMLVNGTEYSLGTAGATTTITPKVFRVPEHVPAGVTTPIEYRLYGWGLADTNTTLRIDDMEVVGVVGTVPTNTLAARFPFTGSTLTLTNTAVNARLSVSPVTSSGTGPLTRHTSSFTSDSGVPVLAVSGLDGDAQSRYVAFDIKPRWDTAFMPTLVSLYARTGSGAGTIKAELVAGGTGYSLGSYVVGEAATPYYFAVPQGLLARVTDTLQVRLYGWGFESAATTLRMDDWTVEGVLTALPPRGTLIEVF